MTRHFLALGDETPSGFSSLLKRAAYWKKSVKSGKVKRILAGTGRRTSPRVLAMIFEKPSTRTRVSFEMAMHHLGGQAMYLSPQEIGLRKRESTKDVAAVLGRYVDAIMARVFNHSDILELARHSGIPVVNGLSDHEHPCQGLGDLLTICERGGRKGSVVSFVGAGNNVSHSLMLGAALCGMEFRWIGPAGYEPKASVLERAKSFGGKVVYSQDTAALKGSGFVYTDVWASMGQESEAEERRRVFSPYQVNDRAMSYAPKAKVLHCLPAHRGEEITDSVIDSPNSVVLDQAENRLYAQMAVLEMVMKGK